MCVLLSTLVLEVHSGPCCRVPGEGCVFGLQHCLPAVSPCGADWFGGSEPTPSHPHLTFIPPHSKYSFAGDKRLWNSGQMVAIQCCLLRWGGALWVPATCLMGLYMLSLLGSFSHWQVVFMSEPLFFILSFVKFIAQPVGSLFFFLNVSSIFILLLFWF